MTATAMKTRETDGVLLRNRQIRDIVGQISPSYAQVMAIVVYLVAVMVCGHHGAGPTPKNEQLPITKTIHKQRNQACRTAMDHEVNSKHCPVQYHSDILNHCRT